MNKFWLIQRGSFRDNLKERTGLLGGRDYNVVNPDYMGAAEFEWGAIPRAYRRIFVNKENYQLFVTDLKTISGVPFCIFCKKDKYEAILTEIKEYLNNDTHYQTKEYTNMEAHFRNPKGSYEIDHFKWARQTNFWWCIDHHELGDWMAFTGAKDRQNAIVRVINQDYKSYWLQLTDEEREKIKKDLYRW